MFEYLTLCSDFLTIAMLGNIAAFTSRSRMSKSRECFNQDQKEIRDVVDEVKEGYQDDREGSCVKAI